MRRTLIMVLVLMVVAPVGLLSWLGARAVRDDRSRIEWTMRELAESRLAVVDIRIGRVLDEMSRSLLDVTELSTYEPSHLRHIVRETPEIDALFVQAVHGPLVFPPLGQELSRDETEFLVRTRRIFEQRLLLTAGTQVEAAPGLKRYGKGSNTKAPVGPAHGWFPWYWDSGLHVIFWRHDPAGNLVGVELNRMRFLADMIEELPPSGGNESSIGGDERLVLLDSNGREVYSWGGARQEDRDVVQVRRSLGAPLGSWSVRHEYPAESGASDLIYPLSGLVLAGLVLTGLAVFFYRESSRELREAQQRVRFVSQVSHELRTPLTNIRLYAELLEGRLEDGDNGSCEHIGVIVSESERLSRLIDNVLAFARHRRGELTVRCLPGQLDEVVAAVVEVHRPSLEASGVDAKTAFDTPRPTLFNRDAVEQILGNLLNNVEKYAPNSGDLEVQSFHRGSKSVVRVRDRGPGIPNSESGRVFEAFVRLSDRLTEGVSGAGIGLTIARDLATMQGGELVLVPVENGACFELVLPLVETADEMPARRG